MALEEPLLAVVAGFVTLVARVVDPTEAGEN